QSFLRPPSSRQSRQCEGSCAIKRRLIYWGFQAVFGALTSSMSKLSLKPKRSWCAPVTTPYKQSVLRRKATTTPPIAFWIVFGFYINYHSPYASLPIFLLWNFIDIYPLCQRPQHPH